MADQFPPAIWNDGDYTWNDLTAFWGSDCPSTITWNDLTATWDSLTVSWRGCVHDETPTPPAAETRAASGLGRRGPYLLPEQQRLQREDDELVAILT